MPRLYRQLLACKEPCSAGGSGCRAQGCPGQQLSSAGRTRTGTHWPPPYLFKCISCNRLESLFHINGLLGTGFKVGDVVFTVAPGLCPFCGDLGGQRAASPPSATQEGGLTSRARPETAHIQRELRQQL